ncbi:MAG: hypothetical protein Kow0020_06460 [Wenzhouxiangellaceae bacterium]
MSRGALILLMALFALCAASLGVYLYRVSGIVAFHDNLAPELIGICIEGFLLVGLLTLIQRAREAARRRELWLSLRGSLRGLLSNIDIALLEPYAEPLSSQQLERDPDTVDGLLERLSRKRPGLEGMLALKQEAADSLALTRDLLAVAAHLSAAHMNWWVAIVDAIRRISQATARDPFENALHDLLFNLRQFDRLEL